jgi:hypothetical protein
MWCIPKVTPEFIARMEHLLDLYALPYREQEPVVCIDEKSKQLLKDTRTALPMTHHTTRRRDYEYKRNGTRNIFCAVEPKGGRRRMAVTKRRTKQDFATFIATLVQNDYPDADLIHIVCDNLNTHFSGSFYETFGKKEGDRILSRIQFHYTPKHASWLDMAEIELSVLSRTAIKGRIPTEEDLMLRTQRFERARNERRATIKWKFTKHDARRIMKYQVQN